MVPADLHYKKCWSDLYQLKGNITLNINWNLQEGIVLDRVNMWINKNDHFFLNFLKKCMTVFKIITLYHGYNMTTIKNRDLQDFTWKRFARYLDFTWSTKNVQHTQKRLYRAGMKALRRMKKTRFATHILFAMSLHSNPNLNNLYETWTVFYTYKKS